MTHLYMLTAIGIPIGGTAQSFLFMRVIHEIDRLLRLSATKNEIYNSDENVVQLFKDESPHPMKHTVGAGC